MPRYYHEHSYHKQTQFIKRLKLFMLFLLLAGIAGGAYLGFDTYRANQEAQAPSAPTDLVTSVYAPTKEVFTTQYFQFEADKTWSTIATETGSNMFTYRSSKRGLTLQDLTIIINEPAQRPVGRTMPVEINKDGVLVPGDTSPLCSTLLPKDVQKVDQTATFQGTRFLCDYDATDYTVMIGLKNGSAPLTLTRPNGTNAKYTIVYRNLGATPDDAAIRQIISTFQTR